MALPDFKNAADQICEAGRVLDAKNMAPATSGNYSARLNDGSIAMTVSGFHKGRLKPENIMRLDYEGAPLENKKPSDETLLHIQLYKFFPAAQAILHVHSVPGSVLTRLQSGDVTLQGYEMLKVFPGIETHETSVAIPVVENSQDMEKLSAEVAQKITPDTPAYLIRDHGFYVWGESVGEALNICEGLEYLLSCEVELYKIKARA